MKNLIFIIGLLIVTFTAISQRTIDRETVIARTRLILVGDTITSIGDYMADEITLDTLGTPTDSTVQYWNNATQSAGIITAADIITDGGLGTIDLRAFTGILKTTNSKTGSNVLFDIAGVTGQALTDNDVNFICVDYNSGSPQYIVTLTNTANNHTIFHVGKVYRKGASVDILNTGTFVNDMMARIQQHHLDEGALHFVSGGIVGEVSTLSISLTAGVLYAGLNRLISDAINTGTGDTFEYYYYNGSAWIEGDSTKIDSMQYNDIASGLATLSNNRYGVHWVYKGVGTSTAVVFGQASYTLAAAQAAQPPVSLPEHITEMAVLRAKIIIFKAASTFTEISSFKDESFTSTTPSNHNELSNLDAGEAGYYGHLTLAENTTVTNFQDSVTANTDVTANTSARHGAITMSGTYDYITLSTQDIVRGQIDLATDVTNALPSTDYITDFQDSVTANTNVVANSAFTATPSTIITAGTDISWSGNTLNVAVAAGLWESAVGVTQLISSEPIQLNDDLTTAGDINLDGNEVYNVGALNVGGISPVGKFQVDGDGVFDVLGLFVNNANDTVLSVDDDGRIWGQYIETNNGGSVYLGLDVGKNDDGTNNYNVGIGAFSLNNVTTGKNNTANGTYSLRNLTTGNSNTANGYFSLYSLTTGSNNTANGTSSLGNLTTGSNNTSNGYNSLNALITGSNNTANGYFSLYSLTSGLNNTANGTASLRNLTTGSNNTASGNNTLYALTSGLNNTANGTSSLGDLTTGNNNTSNGYFSLNALITGSNNTANGMQAGYSVLGTGSVFIGYQAGYNFTGSNEGFIDNSSDATPVIHMDFATDIVTINDILVIAPRASAPGTPVEGMIYSNSTDNHLYFYNGTIWVQLDN